MPNDIFSFDPFVDFNAYRDALRQLVESGRIIPRDFMPSAMTAVVIPIDLIDTGPAIVVQANLPGVKAEDVNITVTGTTLNIKGTVQEHKEFQDASYLRRERRTTNFSRSVPLPVAVNAEQGEARFKDGILTLTLPKAENIQPKNVKVVQE